jgi:hypothetical protein
MITTNLTGNLGNHMWQYAVCRTIAEKRIWMGYKLTTSHDYFGGKKPIYDVDFGNQLKE